MIAEQADSPDKVSVVNKSPTTLTSTGGLVTAVPNSPNRSTVRFSPFSFAGAKTAHIGMCIFPRLSTTSKSDSDKVDTSIGNIKFTGIPSNWLPGVPHNKLGSPLSSPKKADIRVSCDLAFKTKVKIVIAENKIFLPYFFSSINLFLRLDSFYQVWFNCLQRGNKLITFIPLM
jgi:hypothetical protein